MKIKSLEETKHEITRKEITDYLENFARDHLNTQKFLSQLADGFRDIESHNVRVSDLVVNHVTYSDLRKIESLDIETRVQYVRRGLMASIWGAHIWVVNGVPDLVIKIYGERNTGEVPGPTALTRDFPSISEAKILLGIDQPDLPQEEIKTAEPSKVKKPENARKGINRYTLPRTVEK
jgi:hypothetical protein